MMYGYEWWTPMGFIFMIGFVAFVAWLIIREVQPSISGGTETRELDEVTDRYARGEIDGEEYRARKSIIERSA